MFSENRATNACETIQIDFWCCIREAGSSQGFKRAIVSINLASYNLNRTHVVLGWPKMRGRCDPPIVPSHSLDQASSAFRFSLLISTSSTWPGLSRQEMNHVIPLYGLLFPSVLSCLQQRSWGIANSEPKVSLPKSLPIRGFYHMLQPTIPFCLFSRLKVLPFSSISARL